MKTSQDRTWAAVERLIARSEKLRQLSEDVREQAEIECRRMNELLKQSSLLVEQSERILREPISRPRPG